MQDNFEVKVASGNIAQVKYALQGDPTLLLHFSEGSLFRAAINAGCHEIVEILLAHPLTDPSRRHFAYLLPDKLTAKCVQVLLHDKRVPLEAITYTIACANLECVQWLIASGREFDWSAGMFDGLFMASENAKLLARHKANPQQVTQEMRALLSIQEFEVTEPPLMTPRQYCDYLNGKGFPGATGSDSLFAPPFAGTANTVFISC